MVEFEDVRFLRATIVPKEGDIDLTIVLQQGTGLFEITESGFCVVTGIIRKLDKPFINAIDLPTPVSNLRILKSNEFYSELKIRGYHYNGDFQSVLETNGLTSKIKWTGNWVTLLDAALQLCLIQRDSQNLLWPTRIQTIRINPEEQFKKIMRYDNNTEMVNCNYYTELDTLIAGGIEITHMTTKNISRTKSLENRMIYSYKFHPHFVELKIELRDIVNVCVQIAFENNLSLKYKIVQIETETSNDDSIIIDLFRDILSKKSLVKFDLHFLKFPHDLKNIIVQNENIAETVKECTFVVGTNLFCLNNNNINDIIAIIPNGGFLLSRENNKCIISKSNYLQKVTQFRTDKEWFALFRKSKMEIMEPTVIDISSSDKSNWLIELKKSQKNGEKTILVAQNDQLSGIIGLVKYLRKEQNGHNISCILVKDSDAPKFNTNDPFYKNQLSLNLAYNVYENVCKIL